MGVDPQLIVVFVVLGAFVGLLAGLLGIGGGMTMVPLLTIIFTQQGFPLAHVVHMAVATSTATIIFTALSSAREHHKHGAVLWAVVAGLAPGIIVGSLVGPQIVGGMSTGLLAGFFGVFVAFSATQMLIDRKPRPSRELPGKPGLFAVGGGIGLISSMVGAGGGFLSVPFMSWCNVKIHNAVATSAALGLPDRDRRHPRLHHRRRRRARHAAVLAGLHLPAGADLDRRRQHADRTDRRAHRAQMAGEEAEARVRAAAVRAGGVHAVEGVERVGTLTSAGPVPAGVGEIADSCCTAVSLTS